MTKYLPLFALLLLTACAPVKGKVIDKTFVPHHTDIVTTCMFVGKTTMCGPSTKYTPDRWWLAVRDCQDDDCDVVTVGVDADTYSRYNAGDWFDEEKQ